jgi:hypothetical protein
MRLPLVQVKSASDLPNRRRENGDAKLYPAIFTPLATSNSDNLIDSPSSLRLMRGFRRRMLSLLIVLGICPLPIGKWVIHPLNLYYSLLSHFRHIVV